MYGKSFESKYDGSMIGAGFNVFAVWDYIITKTRRGAIELNPKLMAFILGGSEKEVLAAINFLCSPDVRSRSKEEGGARLVKEGEYQYRVVNWDYYSGIRNELDRREYNRVKQSEYRLRRRGKPVKGEMEHERLMAQGADQEALDAAVTANLPASMQ